MKTSLLSLLYFNMNTKGQVKNVWLGKTVIHSDHRFTYEDVQQIIETKEGHLSEQVLLLNDIAKHFVQKGFRKVPSIFHQQKYGLS